MDVPAKAQWPEPEWDVLETSNRGRGPEPEWDVVVTSKRGCGWPSVFVFFLSSQKAIANYSNVHQ